MFGEKGWMVGSYQGTLKQLPDIARPPLPPAVAAGGHGGSHGHLSHEFVTAILENREPLVNVYEALAMTVPGIVAHQSSLKDGERLPVPQFERPRNAARDFRTAKRDSVEVTYLRALRRTDLLVQPSAAPCWFLAV